MSKNEYLGSKSNVYLTKKLLNSLNLNKYNLQIQNCTTNENSRFCSWGDSIREKKNRKSFHFDDFTDALKPKHSANAVSVLDQSHKIYCLFFKHN